MQPVFREAVYWQTRRSDISGSPALSFTYSPDICKVSATAISSVSQLWEQTLCNYFPLLAFPFVPSLSGIMVASFKRRTFYYMQHPLSFVPLSEFTGNANFHCLYPGREVRPQPGTISCCFFHSSSHPSFFSYP